MAYLPLVGKHDVVLRLKPIYKKDQVIDANNGQQKPANCCEKQKAKKVFCEAAWYLQEPTTFTACSKF
jgi:hypothetical protein